MPLWNRKVRVTVADLSGIGPLYEDLDIEFDCNHDRGRRPDRAEVTIYNLSAESRNFIQSSDRRFVQIEAGYGDILGIVGQGQITYSNVEWDGPDCKTSIVVADGIDSITTRTLSLSLGPGTTLQQVTAQVIAAFGLPTGIIAPLRVPVTFETGITLTGYAANALDWIAEQVDARWFIQDGRLMLTLDDQPSPNLAPVLSPDTGLIGSPRWMTREDHGGRVRVVGIEAECLLQSSLRPQDPVIIESNAITGTFVCQRVQHVGDNFGGDFKTRVEAINPLEHRPL